MKKTNTIHFSYLSVFVIISTLLYLFPFHSDDWIFSEAKNIGQCISSTWNYYHNGNGRIIPNFLSYLSCGVLPKWGYALMTGIAFSLFLYCIIRLSKINDGIIFVALCLLFLPVPLKTIFWRCGSANYLYPALFMLISIIMFTSKTKEKNIIKYFVFLIIGIITGISHEAVGLPLLGGFFIYICIERKSSMHQSIILIGVIIGLLFNLLAPGTSIRVNGLQTAPFFNFLKCIYSELTTAYFSIINLLLFLFVIRRNNFYLFFQKNKLIILLWIVNVSFLISISIFNVPVAGRVLFYQECIALLLFIRILSYIKPDVFEFKYLNICSFILLLAICIHHINFFKSYTIATDKEIQALKESNDSVQRANTIALLINPNSTTNKSFSRIFNKPILYGLKSPIYEDLYVNGELDRNRQTTINNQIWYNYFNFFIKEIDEKEHYSEAIYQSVPYLPKAPLYINNTFAKVVKEAKIPVYIIHSKNGKKFVVVPIEGRTTIKKVISMTLL